VSVAPNPRPRGALDPYVVNKPIRKVDGEYRSHAEQLSILVVTNMYPTAEAPNYGTFVAEQVEALRGLDDVETVEVLFLDGRKSALNYLRGARKLRKVMGRNRFDLVHAHHGLAGAVAITQAQVPVVITFHGSDLSYYAWQRWASRFAARRAVVNICVSAAAATRVRPGAVHLPCGIDLERFAPVDRPSARRSFEVPEGAIAMLFPGPRAHPQKAYPRFEEVRDTLRSRGHRVHELRLENVDRANVPRLLAAADAVVMTSVSEGSPVSLMEALAGGVPIVATDVGDVRSMIDGVPNCVVAPYDRNVFASAIEGLVNEEPRTPALRSQRFDQRRIVAGLRRLYAEGIGW
jgi:teichuronic acid biosynthesis glycosyltransferase TuaC